MSAEDAWSISVKTIGGSPQQISEHGGERKFTITVSPEDTVTVLHSQIEENTGLKASQQRLIYRGRLIGNNGEVEVEKHEPKIKDIAGLCDGQTIHLVRKRDAGLKQDQAGSDTNMTGSADSSSSSDSPSRNSDDDSARASGSGNPPTSLLAALLGLGGADGDDSERPESAAGGARSRGAAARSSRLGRSRRPNYRLTPEDLDLPDPGSMEPVRQSLMTLHTILPHARTSITDPGAAEASPLDANRQWHRGQWIDCRDTVNQWLEATVVDIVYPDDILPPLDPARRRPRSETVLPANDPAVGANDLEGRRRLLLEPCESDDSDAEEGELAGFRRRDNNDQVQLLLIHYNGWPHRWDEWIRSDSERVRPFRTRTRHPSMASHSSPTPQSVFNEAPATFIRGDTEAADRASLLPELRRILTTVSELVDATTPAANEIQGGTDRPAEHLPWIGGPSTTEEKKDVENAGDDANNEKDNEIGSQEGNEDSDEEIEDLPPLLPREEDEDDSAESVVSSSGECRHPQFDPRQLELLAPVLDRLGRALTDAAPHIAALAAANRARESENETLPEDEPDRGSESNDGGPLGGLLSLLTRDRRRQSGSTGNRGSGSGTEGSEQGLSAHDPDYTDFATGLVNTHRGEVRGGPRDRGQQDDVANLLGAYLAAASLSGLAGNDDSENGEETGNNLQGLSRLLRERGSGNGGGGGGIDIHIHAIVTTPGATPGGGIGVATLGGGTAGLGGARALFSPPSRESRSSILRSRTQAALEQDDDDGIFSDLYSENPTPVDPNGNIAPEEQGGDQETSIPGRLDLSSTANTAARGRMQASGLLGEPRAETPPRPHRSSSRSRSTSSTSRSGGNTSPRRGNAFTRIFRRSRR